MSCYVKAAVKSLPHEVIEIAAHLFAASYGLWLGVTVVRRMLSNESTFLRHFRGEKGASRGRC